MECYSSEVMNCYRDAVSYARLEAEQVGALQALGYTVEDMATEHGPEFAGQYRWLNTKNDEFQDADTSDSVDAAWQSAAEYEAWRAEYLASM